MRAFLLYFVIPIMVALEVIGVSKLYSHCEKSLWELFLLYIGVYITYEAYRRIKNYCDDVLY